MKRASMYSTILVATLAIGTAGPASAQSGSTAGAGGQSGSSAGPAGQSGTTGTGSGQSGASGGQAGTSGAGDNTSVASGAQSGASSPRRDDRQEFIEKAAIANMAEIQLGQLASTNAEDPQVKQFAQMMVTEHTQALDQLRSAAGSATLPSSLDSKHQKVHDKLSKLHGAEFDRAYMDAMVDAHKDAEKLLSKRAGKNHDARSSDATSGQSAMAGGAGSAGAGSSTSGSASGTAGTSGSGNTTSATGTSGAGTPSQSGDASGTVSGSTSGASASGAVGTSGSSSSYGSGASSTPGSVDEWAAMTLPKVKNHLDQARSLENQVKQQSKGGKSNGNSNEGAPAQPQQQ